MLHAYENIGLRELWLTPHIMEDVPNDTAFLRDRFEKFQEAYNQDFHHRSPEGKEQIRLHLSAENMLDALFQQRLRAGDLLPLDDKYLLVETSIFSAPMNFAMLFERIKNKGFIPVLAHPERYLYLEKGEYEKLKLRGVKFQRNAFSIKGQYGDKVKKRCQWLMKHNMYDFVGSDLHSLSTFEKYSK